MTQNPFPPVPLSPRHDGWTPEKQWRFIETLAATASVVQAARMVGMSVRSAQRLRRHPLAADFRAAWDGALAQVWGALEHLALDRAVNGEREVISRDGYAEVERRRPCSDRLLIHLLGSRERAVAAARAERAEAHERAMAEYRLAAIRARSEAAGRRGRKVAKPAGAPVKPDLLTDAAAETAALQAFHAQAAGFGAWPAMEDCYALYGLPADEAAVAAARVAALVAAAAEKAEQEAGEPEVSAEFANRPRWEDFRAADVAARGGE